jgi:ribonuclease HI
MDSKIVYLGFDGSCEPNPGLGGYGSIIQFGSKQIRIAGADPETTNNRMEIMGLLRGLEVVLERGMVGHLQIIGDSEYVLKSASVWMWKWKRKNFKKKANVDLWKKMDVILTKALEQFDSVTYWWIRGHSGHLLNELCDELSFRLVNNESRVEKQYELEQTLEVDLSVCSLVLKQSRLQPGISGPEEKL